MSHPMINLLDQWKQRGWLRPLDVALARFIHETDPDAPGSLLLVAALTAHLEGRGHTALEIAGWPQCAVEALPGLAPEAAEAITAAVRQALISDGICGDATVADIAAVWAVSRSIAIESVESERGTAPGGSPLVLSGGLVMLRRHWRHEVRVAARVAALCAPLPTADQPDADRLERLLDRLFPPSPDAQRQACAVALRSRLTLVTGGPGTGKTTTASRMLVLLQALRPGPEPLRVALAAPTGKAAARLRESITGAVDLLDAELQMELGVPQWWGQLGPARTLHALLGAQPGTRRLRHDASHPLDVDVVFVDEASMVNLELMDALLDALPDHARLVLLGDRDQLASVEAGAVMGDLCAAVHGPLAQRTVTLHRTHRFGGPIAALAQAVKAGDAAAVLRGLDVEPVRCLTTRDPRSVRALALQGWQAAWADLTQGPAGPPEAPEPFETWAARVLRGFESLRVLCAVREGPWGVPSLNAAIEQALREAGLIADRGEWYAGRLVMVTRNDPALGVFNGDVGVVLRAPTSNPRPGQDVASDSGSGPALVACFPNGPSVRCVSVSRLSDVESAYAMTVHKSQGSEFDHVALVLPEADAPVLTREWLYTGLTRARSALTVVAADPGLVAQAVGRPTRRVGGLKGRLPA